MNSSYKRLQKRLEKMSSRFLNYNIDLGLDDMFNGVFKDVEQLQKEDFDAFCRRMARQEELEKELAKTEEDLKNKKHYFDHPEKYETVEEYVYVLEIILNNKSKDKWVSNKISKKLENGPMDVTFIKNFSNWFDKEDTPIYDFKFRNGIHKYIRLTIQSYSMTVETSKTKKLKKDEKKT